MKKKQIITKIVSVGLAAGITLFGTSFVMRYGGDEFLAITDITWHNYRAKINHAVKKVDMTQKYPFHLSLSVGQVLIKDLSIPLDEYVSEADSRMYEIKKKKKIMRKS